MACLDRTIDPRDKGLRAIPHRIEMTLRGFSVRLGMVKGIRKWRQYVVILASVLLGTEGGMEAIIGALRDVALKACLDRGRVFDLLPPSKESTGSIGVHTAKMVALRKGMAVHHFIAHQANHAPRNELIHMLQKQCDIGYFLGVGVNAPSFGSIIRLCENVITTLLAIVKILARNPTPSIDAAYRVWQKLHN
jgi:hypothetical protein